MLGADQSSQWGYDNRTVGPARAAVGSRATAASRTACAARDANPYLAIAASLACGTAGHRWKSLQPADPDRRATRYERPFALPRSADHDALRPAVGARGDRLRAMLGEPVRRGLLRVP
ncbi:MAG: hypothetical protein MZV49_04945 [Rhodopseudomonas palustris]|nr:hypothetical protein [Rhodopseudomonas palustris]